MTLLEKLHDAESDPDIKRRSIEWSDVINVTNATMGPETLTTEVLCKAERMVSEMTELPAWLHADMWASYHRVRCILDPTRPTTERDAAIMRQSVERVAAFPCDTSFALFLRPGPEMPLDLLPDKIEIGDAIRWTHVLLDGVLPVACRDVKHRARYVLWFARQCKVFCFLVTVRSFLNESLPYLELQTAEDHAAIAFVVGWSAGTQCFSRNAHVAARRLLALEGVEMRLLATFGTLSMYTDDVTVPECVASFWRLAYRGNAFDECALLVATMGKLVVYSHEARACYVALGIPWSDPRGDWQMASFAIRDHFFPEVKARISGEMSALLIEEEETEAAAQRRRTERRRQKRHRRKQRTNRIEEEEENVMEEVVSETVGTEDESLLESCLVCPITCERLRDPVVLNDGHTYERRAIEEWMTRSTRSPLTNDVLDPRALVPNHALRAVLEAMHDGASVGS